MRACPARTSSECLEITTSECISYHGSQCPLRQEQLAAVDRARCTQFTPRLVAVSRDDTEPRSRLVFKVFIVVLFLLLLILSVLTAAMQGILSIRVVCAVIAASILPVGLLLGWCFEN